VCKRPTSPTISIPNSNDDSSGSGGKKHPAAKKAWSDTAVGRLVASHPKPCPKACPEVVMVTWHTPAMFKLVHNVQQLHEEVLAAFAMLISYWEGMAQANVLQGKGKGKERAP
jgi:hypothetical protein